MFITHQTPIHKLRTQYHTPAHSSPLSSSPLQQSPSPLSTRHYNIPSAAFDSMLSPTPTPTKCSSIPKTSLFSPGASSSASTNSTQRESLFSKRKSKPNPLMHRSTEEGRETRRKLFLKQVKEGSEEKRWQKRGGDDEMMRRIFMLEERREMERRRREAAREEVLGLEEMEIELEMQDERQLDFEAVRMEEEELEALIQERELKSGIIGGVETPYCSDEEEYDELFMHIIREEMKATSHQQSQSQRDCATDADMDVMDMS